MAIATPLSTVPIWQRPALILARWHRGLESFVEVDRIMLDRIRVPGVAIVAYILVVTVVPSFFHAIAEFGDVNVLTLTRVALRSVFTESMPFMAAGLLLGMLAPTAGAGLVTVFIPLDLVAAAIQQQELTPLLPSTAGRAVSYWLLWLLVVEIPILVRTGFLSVDRSGPAQRAVAFMLAVGAGFVMPWVWAQAVTMLIRPVFTWSDLYAPYYAAVGPVQEGGNFLGLVGALGAAAVTTLYLKIQPGQGVSLLFAPPDRRRRPLGLIPVTIVLTLALLGGLITTVLDLVLLAVAVVSARPIASFLRRRIRVWPRVASIPWVIRFAVAFGLAYLAAGVIVVPLYQTTGGSEFLPLVLAEIVILVVYELLCGEEETEPAPGKNPAATGVGAIFLFLGAPLALLLLIPLTARADNCSSRSDCWPTPWPAAAAAAGVGGAAMMNKNRQKPPDKPSIKKARDATDLLSKAPGVKQLPIQKKLVGALLGWQFDTANEISRQLGDDPPRDDFEELAEVVARPRPPIPHADLLGPEMTAALEKSYEAHQTLLAHGEAAVISFDRYGGARRAGARQWVERQAMAVIEHKKAMAPALRAAADAVQEAWRLAESFKPTGNVPDSILDHLTAADFDYARGLGRDESAIRARGEAMASDRGIPDDEDINRIKSSYRGLAGSFERLPFPATSISAG